MDLFVLGDGDQELNVEDGAVFILEMCLEPGSGVDVSPSTQETCDGGWSRHLHSSSPLLVVLLLRFRFIQIILPMSEMKRFILIAVHNYKKKMK